MYVLYVCNVCMWMCVCVVYVTHMCMRVDVYVVCV